jgi:ABC-type transport system substrate-binding protein
LEPLLEGKFLGGYEPRLATDYKVADDGLSITFYLRKGVKFHDGTDFNADAVKFNVDAMIKAGKYSKNVLSCDVIDPYTVKINLKRFENVSLGGVAGTVIASPSAVQKNGEDWAAIHAVGTGPFKQVSYEPDVKIRVERFDGYWGQKPYLDAIEGTFISDPVTQIMAMKAGMGDATHSREAKTTYQLVSAGFKVLQNYMGMVAITPNSRDKNSPFYDERVRMALEYAINKKAIVDTFGYGFWEVADQMPVPGQNGYLADIVPRSYNPAKAKE